MPDSAATGGREGAMTTIIILTRGLVLGLALCASAPVFAQDYPTRPITMLVPQAPGASSDGIETSAAPGYRNVT